MHATKNRSKSYKEGFTISTKKVESRFPVEVLQQMAARSHRIGDKRRKLKERDERRFD